MPAHIKKLRITIRVLSSARSQGQRQLRPESHPTLVHRRVMPITPESNVKDISSEMLPPESARQETRDHLDAYQVCDVVYELMRQEARIGRCRKGKYS